MNKNTKNPVPMRRKIGWQSLLSKSDTAELFHTVFLGGTCSGYDQIENGAWRMFDDAGNLLYEVIGYRGVVPASADNEVHTIFERAFSLFPEAFGRSGILVDEVGTGEQKTIPKICA